MNQPPPQLRLIARHLQPQPLDLLRLRLPCQPGQMTRLPLWQSLEQMLQVGRQSNKSWFHSCLLYKIELASLLTIDISEYVHSQLFLFLMIWGWLGTQVQTCIHAYMYTHTPKPNPYIHTHTHITHTHTLLNLSLKTHTLKFNMQSLLCWALQI